MVALLVTLSIMAIMMTAVMPVWRQMAQREKETELVFRGEQYARAIGLFQRKTGPGALPPSIDVLVEQRYLRKKFKDPITNDDFAPVLLGAAAPGGTAGTQPGLRTGGAQPGGFGRITSPEAGTPTGAGITGVTSKSKDKSIRIYKGRTHYNEWLFTFTPPALTAGAGGTPGTGGPGQRGGRGNQGPGNPQGPPPFGGPGGGRGPGGPAGGRGPNGPGNPNAPNIPNGPGRGGPVFGPPGR